MTNIDFSSLDKFLSPEVKYVKVTPIVLDDEELLIFADMVISFLVERKIRFLGRRYLPATERVDSQWEITTLPATLSFYVGAGKYINISANGTVFHKGQNKTLTIARLWDADTNGERWVIWYQAFNSLLPSIIKMQEERVR